MNQFEGRATGVFTAMQKAQLVESEKHDSEDGEQPSDEEAVGVIVADEPGVLLSPAVGAAFVRDLATALGHAQDRQRTGLPHREVGQPFGFHDGPSGFGLAVAHDANRLPGQCLPRIEIIGIPELDAVLAFAERPARAARAEALFHGG